MTDQLDDLPQGLDDLQATLATTGAAAKSLDERMRDFYSAYVLRKARKLREDGRLHPTDTLGLYGAGGMAGNYRVQVLTATDQDELSDADDGTGLPFVSCECENGSNLGGRPRCYHSAAAIYDTAETLERI